ILIHRYLGVVLGLLFVVWFLSGIGLMYAGENMPTLTPETRFLKLPAIDVSRIRITANEAGMRVDSNRGINRIVVSAILDRPVYRLASGRDGTIVYADDGTVLERVDEAMAKTIAARFVDVPESELHYSLLTEPNQWTIGQRRQLSLHKFNVDDPAHTELYVSPLSGEVVLLTTRGTRALAWVAA